MERGGRKLNHATACALRICVCSLTHEDDACARADFMSSLCPLCGSTLRATRTTARSAVMTGVFCRLCYWQTSVSHFGDWCLQARAYSFRRCAPSANAICAPVTTAHISTHTSNYPAEYIFCMSGRLRALYTERESPLVPVVHCASRYSFVADLEVNAVLTHRVSLLYVCDCHALSHPLTTLFIGTYQRV